MLKSILLAGVLLVTSNFMPIVVGHGPDVIAANTHCRAAAGHSNQRSGRPAVRPPPATVKTFPADRHRQPDPSDGLLPEEREFIARVNDERTSRGLNALELDPLLVAGRPRPQPRDVRPGLLRPPFADIGPEHADGPLPQRPASERPGHAGYLLVGENIYYCSESNETYNVEFGHQALMNSPGHRANILEPRFAKIGVGIYRDAKGQFWVTEMFLRETKNPRASQ